MDKAISPKFCMYATLGEDNCTIQDVKQYITRIAQLITMGDPKVTKWPRPDCLELLQCVKGAAQVRVCCSICYHSGLCM
jgi:hypothetical protein